MKEINNRLDWILNWIEGERNVGDWDALKKGIRDRNLDQTEKSKKWKVRVKMKWKIKIWVGLKTVEVKVLD